MRARLAIAARRFAASHEIQGRLDPPERTADEAQEASHGAGIVGRALGPGVDVGVARPYRSRRAQATRVPIVLLPNGLGCVDTNAPWGRGWPEGPGEGASVCMGFILLPSLQWEPCLCKRGPLIRPSATF